MLETVETIDAVIGGATPVEAKYRSYVYKKSTKRSWFKRLLLTTRPLPIGPRRSGDGKRMSGAHSMCRNVRPTIWNLMSKPFWSDLGVEWYDGDLNVRVHVRSILSHNVS